jgi:hypothetical protein
MRKSICRYSLLMILQIGVMSNIYVYEMVVVTWNKIIKVQDKSFVSISQEGSIAFTVNIGMALSLY